MSTIINNPGPSNSGDEGLSVGMVIGILVIILIIILFFVYALPAIRGKAQPATNNGGTNINVTVPNPTSGNGQQQPQGGNPSGY